MIDDLPSHAAVTRACFVLEIECLVGRCEKMFTNSASPLLKHENREIVLRIRITFYNGIQ